MGVVGLAAFLAWHGCSTACASGIIANLKAESELDFCVVARSGIGASQWAGPRRARLMRTLGSSWCEPSQQMGFMMMEMQEIGLRDRLFAETDPAEAARMMMVEYVRPRSRDPQYRQSLAWTVYTQIRAAHLR